ncbi:MAG: hypothetical protein ACRDLP_13315 [Solirubrobacteraceae bacterium]
MRIRAPLAIVVGAIALRLAVGIGFVNYDTGYSLVWGQQLARGQTPSYGTPLAPTPHPLLEAVGFVLAPLGARATLAIVVALAYLSLAWLAYLVALLGARWFSWPVGVAAAALLLSRYEVLSYGVRAYVDLPYVALVLAALAIESRRRQAGWPVLALLALAGLLRPEAWLFAGVYWLSIQHAYSMRGRIALAALVALAPALWVLSDGLITGHPLWSLTNTRSTAKELHRATGIANVPYYGARRLGEVLGQDGLVGAAVGGVLALWLTRSRALLGAAAAVVALVAFAIIAAAGLPIQDRYVFLMAAIGLVFAGAGLFGWRSLAADDPHRRLWQAASAVIAVAILSSIAWDVPRFHKTFASSNPADQSLDAQQRIANDLVALVPHAHCLPVSVPFATPVPLLALYLHTSPANVKVAQIGRGTIIVPANAGVRTTYLLDPHDLRITQRIGPGFRQVAANRSWRVYSTC